MRTLIILICGLLLFIVGCAEVPKPINFSLVTQEQFQSARHWQMIAQRLVDRLIQDPDLAGIVKPGAAPRIFLEMPGKSPFDEAYKKYLITELIDAKFLLSAKADDAPIRISWGHQLVNRNPERIKPQGFPEMVVEATWEFLTGARWTARGPLVSHTEIILTTWITVGDKLPPIKTYSDTFYINDGDWSNYQMASGYFHPRSVAAQDDAWKRRLAQQGLLSQ